MTNTKIIAMYLPQFHCIPENDKFWGKGFTDWVTVKKARPLFKGHHQPVIPLNNNYYDLSVKENVAWQAKLAREHGIYGFGIYHYWFNNEQNILTKPAEIIRDNEEIDINYFFAWDNANWKRSWSNVHGNAWSPMADNVVKDHKGQAILIPYILGRESDWEYHYKELRSYFLDKRYIKKENRPVFVILQYSAEIAEMCAYWNCLAKKDGYDGMCFIFKYNQNLNFREDDLIFNYEPICHGWTDLSISVRIRNKLHRILRGHKGLKEYDYDTIWRKILVEARNSKANIYHGAFVSYDDTPRRGYKGVLVNGSTPEKFKSYLFELMKISEVQGKDFIFLTAWNEWGEGACLEPDNILKYKYLEAILEIVSHQY
mgnify:FL=1